MEKKESLEDTKENFNVFGVMKKITVISFNVCNNIIGAGILFLPYLLRKMGVVLGIGYLIFALFINLFFQEVTYRSLNKTREEIDEYNDGIKDEKKKKGYICTIEGLARYVFPGLVGDIFFWIIKLLVILLLMGILIAYAVILSGLVIKVIDSNVCHYNVNNCVYVPKTFEHVYLKGSLGVNWWIGAIVMFFIFFLCFFGKEIAKLTIINYLSLTSTIVFFFTALILFFIGFTDNKKVGELKWFPDFKDGQTWLDTFSNLGVVIFAFACAMIFALHGKTEKTKNLYIVEVSIFNSLIIVCFAYVSIAFVGYFSFFEATEDNIILSYPCKSIAGLVVVTILRIVIIFQLVLTYPTTQYALLVTIEEAFLMIWNWLRNKIRKTPKEDETKEEKVIKDEKSDEVVSEKPKKNFLSKIFTVGLLRHFVLTFFLCFMIYFVAAIYPNAIQVLGYVGSTVLILYFFVFPTIFFCFLRKDVAVWMRILLGVFATVCTIILGVIPTIISLVEDVKKAMKNDE